MASIQRIAANAVSLNPEVNFSIFHANIDFSLRKCEAPAELLPLGQTLSRQRRELAEEGSLHILARRLGFLFEDILPKVPSLLKAYGTRASEIASESGEGKSPSKSISDGIFGPHIGIDSTSIWAGATSGRPALLMHLLACMLARIFSPQEATAIWAEVVDLRRQAVKKQAADGDGTSNVLAQLAAQYDTDWSSLQGWDASARSWLQIADSSSFRGKQKQIELIANNLSVSIQTQITPNGIGLPASGKTIVADSVIHNFCTALSALDNLISGKPQRILDGGVLLGLTSWHLYPDLVLLGPMTIERQQTDPLVAQGGIATLSIAYQEDPHGNQDGVYWSLPLSSLRYYGKVDCKRSSLHDSKISIPEFQALILGATLDSLDNLSAAVDIIQSLWVSNRTAYRDALQHIRNNPIPPQATYPQSNNRPKALQYDLENSRITELTKRQLVDVVHDLHILSPLMGGVELFLSSNEEDKRVALQLIRYGANCATSWIGNVSNNDHHPFFGVTDLSFLLQAIHRPSERVRVLQEIYQSQCGEPDACIIRFKKEDDTWDYASLLQAVAPHSRKRSRSHFESDSDNTLTPGTPMNEEWVFLSSTTGLPSFNSDSMPDYNCDLSPEDTYRDDHIFTSFLNYDQGASTTIVWDFVLGIHNLAAVYIRRGRSKKESAPRPVVPLATVQRLVKNGSLDLQIAMARIQQYFARQRPDHHFSLLTLGRITDHYKHDFPHLKLSMGVIKECLANWTWARSVVKDLETQHLEAASLACNGIITESIYPRPLTRQQAFASILQFESGSLSVNVDEMEKVMAISSGNSLFIAQSVLNDPIPPANMTSGAVVHAIGNVGKPGIALLVAPEQPEIREHDVEKWHVVNHNPFDGSPSGGSFEASSLHMSFTGWEGPLRVRGPSAFRGMEAYNLETRISMYDQAEWVADLDILEALDSSPDIRSCGLHKKQCGHDPSISATGMEFVSIDCWEELLSPADRPMVLRSGSSWMARLTGVSIASSKGFRCFLLPVHKDICWTCVVDDAGLRNVADRKILFVY
ncbi:uncharacterized protein DSM5745_09741 [Aspergillus mulundensis]|uniref:Uncharacterized protein n=1 Tax=Aspergillus mulundensis TaxID=1810919 RepID=A0A3D8QRR0_9EURO|nr:Uncharacterized protein DSM5745_09741 [Aspergillus mulundensis]RDW64330.1 Uncharacterized protein DSM5745_09741 [Aspergillus mulundensis]